ncbi:MAG: hypothetical protein UZ15_CFX003001483 [Chloroflexi bacterium OLB15]|nr:MAG: hypothetical protein UZ15_CFX003001483 [Chloroflexi bacterium OLB15]
MLLELTGLIACTCIWGIIGLGAAGFAFLSPAVFMGKMNPKLALGLVLAFPIVIIVTVLVAWAAFFSQNTSLATTALGAPIIYGLILAAIFAVASRRSPQVTNSSEITIIEP